MKTIKRAKHNVTTSKRKTPLLRLFFTVRLYHRTHLLLIFVQHNYQLQKLCTLLSKHIGKVILKLSHHLNVSIIYINVMMYGSVCLH